MKTLKELLADLNALGISVRETKSGYQVLTPNGGLVTIHRTESDRRAIKNTLARLKRAGVTLDNMKQSFVLSREHVGHLTVDELAESLTDCNLNYEIRAWTHG